MLFMKGRVPFAITMYPLNYGKISVVPFASIYKGYFYCHIPHFQFILYYRHWLKLMKNHCQALYQAALSTSIQWQVYISSILTLLILLFAIFGVEVGGDRKATN